MTDSANVACHTGIGSLAPGDASALLSSLLASSTDGIAYVDTNAVVCAASERLATDLGVSLKELVGRRAAEVLPGWQAPPPPAGAGGQAPGNSGPETPPGEPHLAPHYAISPVRDAEGGLLGHLLVWRSKSPGAAAGGAERAGAANCRECGLLACFIDSAPIGIAVLRGPEHRYELVNPAYQAIPGLPAVPMVGRRMADVFPDISDAPAMVDEVYRTGNSVHTRGCRAAVGPGREETYWDLDLVPLPGPDGAVDGVLVLSQEATAQILARRQAEELAAQLAAGQAMLKAVIENAPEGIVVADEEAHVLLANAVAARLLGQAIPLGQELGAPDGLHFRYPDGTPCPPQDIPLARSALNGETVSAAELAIVEPDGRRRDLLVNSAPIRDGQGRRTGAVSVFQDVSDSRQIQAERELLLAEVRRLYQAERQARQEAEAAVGARDEFLAAAAHELKTPVTNVRGFAQLLVRRLDRGYAPDARKMRQAVLTIDRQADRLGRLVSQLLDISSLESGQLVLRRKDTDLAALAREVAAQAGEGDQRHKIVLRAPGPAVLPVDGPRLEQILYSLIDNAARFSPEGTSIEIEVSMRAPEAVWLTVRDHGSGIPLERRDRLFSRFYQAQTGRAFAGLGLGLYFCRQIVELHGGRVEADFPPDGGTRIVVMLPREPILARSNGDEA